MMICDLISVTFPRVDDIAIFNSLTRRRCQASVWLARFIRHNRHCSFIFS